MDGVQYDPKDGRIFELSRKCYEPFRRSEFVFLGRIVMSLNPVTASEDLCPLLQLHSNYLWAESCTQCADYRALLEPCKFAGTILEVTPPFVRGRSIEELIAAKILTPLKASEYEGPAPDRPTPRKSGR